MTVSECLTVARAGHQEYRENVTRRASGVIVEGNPTLARAALQRAYDALLEAERLDPTGSDSAWAESPETALHYDMLVFYRQQLEGR